MQDTPVSLPIDQWLGPLKLTAIIIYQTVEANLCLPHRIYRQILPWTELGDESIPKSGVGLDEATVEYMLGDRPVTKGQFIQAAAEHVGQTRPFSFMDVPVIVGTKECPRPTLTLQDRWVLGGVVLSLPSMA